MENRTARHFCMTLGNYDIYHSLIAKLYLRIGNHHRPRQLLTKQGKTKACCKGVSSHGLYKKCQWYVVESQSLNAYACFLILHFIQNPVSSSGFPLKAAKQCRLRSVNTTAGILSSGRKLSTIQATCHECVSCVCLHR